MPNAPSAGFNAAVKAYAMVEMMHIVTCDIIIAHVYNDKHIQAALLASHVTKPQGITAAGMGPPLHRLCDEEALIT